MTSKVSKRKATSESEPSVKKTKTETTTSDNDVPTNTTMPTSYTIPKLNSNHIKLMSWNVAGLQAALRKGFTDYIQAEDATIVLLQEVKIQNAAKQTLIDKTLYPYQYWNDCTSKKGYAGSALVSKIKPISITMGLDDPVFDKEGRLIIAEFEHFHLIACYLPNAGQKLERLPDKLDYNTKLAEKMRLLEQSKPIIWGGDLNVAHTEMDLSRPKTNQKTAGFTPQERSNFTDIIEQEPPLIDTWRHFHPTINNMFTYYGYRFNCRAKNLGWRLDYFVVSKSFLSRVVSSDIRSEAYGASDHVPCILVIQNE